MRNRRFLATLLPIALVRATDAQRQSFLANVNPEDGVIVEMDSRDRTALGAANGPPAAVG